MANLVLTENNGLLEGTPDVDSLAFGIYIVDSVPFTVAGAIIANEGNDDIFTLNPGTLQNGIQLAYGNQGDDNIRLSNLFVAYGGQGNDLIQSGGGDFANDLAGQQMYGGLGNDTIRAGGGNDFIEGNQGFDTIEAGEGLDFALGGQDNDTVLGEASNDSVYGNRGDDSLYGDFITDIVVNGVSVTQGNDLVHGGQGDDELFSGFENGTRNTWEQDTLIGGAGQDTLSGGGDVTGTSSTGTGVRDDLFRYEAGFGVNVGIPNIDYITNFQAWDDPTNNPNVRPDKLSLGIGADAVLQGLNFTTSTTYEVNQVLDPNNNKEDFPVGINGNVIEIANVDTVETYDQAIAAIQTAFTGATRDPIASSSDTLQVYNFLFTGTVGGAFTDNQNFLYINNSDSTVSSVNDMFIQGVAVNVPTPNAANADIIFA